MQVPAQGMTSVWPHRYSTSKQGSTLGFPLMRPHQTRCKSVRRAGPPQRDAWPAAGRSGDAAAAGRQRAAVVAGLRQGSAAGAPACGEGRGQAAGQGFELPVVRRSQRTIARQSRKEDMNAMRNRACISFAMLASRPPVCMQVRSHLDVAVPFAAVVHAQISWLCSTYSYTLSG